jgi:O-antigen/teichoic acid export membrane protein
MKIILNTLLIPRLGLYGAAVASSCSIVALNIVMVIEVFRLIRIHPYERAFLKPILTGIIAILVIYSAKNIPNMDPSWAVPILALAFVISYVILLRLFGIAREDKVIFTRIRERIRARNNEERQE